MKLGAKHWLAALVLSVGLHFSVPYVMQGDKDAMLIEGATGGGEIILLGQSEFDAVAAGAETEVQEASETSEIEPVPTEAVQAEESEELTPQETEAEQVADTQAIEPANSQAYAPSETNPVIEPSQTAALSEPLEAVEEMQPVINPPTPQPRPEPPKPAQPKKTVVQKAKPKAGAGGTANANARRAESQGNQKRSNSSAGNAAVSNYPGTVARRLRRALRYPKSAARQAKGGQAQVGFTVTASGQAVSIRIVASSGSPVLDQAALDAVRRASPFPAIPPEAGRSQWPFVVPMIFAR
ncbi:energy transducer TonB [Rhizobium sp. L1K21]|uniref:energy transducer TonB family protein n=1 Tax=Rhizobium sp. L1K21 TaxID=2954933 RepID=UPI002093FF36|nr:energy transducer TonB [Rhizobium sp. L1K21]MCO6185256.1 energy transducer TonB [Rhizobium sp. L1K21]